MLFPAPIEPVPGDDDGIPYRPEDWPTGRCGFFKPNPESPPRYWGLRCRISVKNYKLYVKIRYHAWCAYEDGEAIPMKSLKMIMDSGHGSFVKEKQNAASIKFVEEKYATFMQGGYVNLRVIGLLYGAEYTTGGRLKY